MENSKQHYKMLGGLCLGLATTIMLAGCPTQPVNNTDATTTKTVPPKNSNIGTRTTASGVTVQVDYTTLNPVLIEFDKSTVQLSDANKEYITHFVERAKKAHHLVIKGFCDRNQFANAKDAAIKRAAVVKEELESLGVLVPIRVMYQTDVADKHAAEIEFPE